MAPLDLAHLSPLPCALCGEPVTQMVVTTDAEVLFVCSGHGSEPCE